MRSVFFLLPNPAHAASVVSHEIKCFQKQIAHTQGTIPTIDRGLTAIADDLRPATSFYSRQDELPLNIPPLAVSGSPFLVLFLNARRTSFRVRRGFLAS